MKNLDKFHTDIVQAIFSAFDNGSINYDPADNNYRDVMLKYLTMLNRLIGPKKRKVHISEELNSKISGTDSESVRIKLLVDDMKGKIENGVDVNGHLSKLVFKQLDKTDKMLDDWNIYHLHLCTGNPDVFDQTRHQSGDLLMVVILNDDAYFIDVTNHSKDDWYDVNYLKIIKNNWEEELLFKFDNIIDIPNLDESKTAIKSIRNDNVNQVAHKIDGYYYRPKYASGYSAAGTSSKAMEQLISVNKFLDKLEFNYSKIEFCEYCTNCLCSLIDTNDVIIDLSLNRP